MSLMLSPDQVEELLPRLTAEQRAYLKWGGDRVRKALSALVLGPPDDLALVRVLHDYLQLSARVMSLLVSTFADRLGVLAQVGAAVEQEFTEVREAFRGQAGFSAIEWSTTCVSKFNAVALSMLEEHLARGGPISMEEIPEVTPEALEQPGLGIVRAELLLFAILLAVRAGANPDAMTEHAEWAYLECAAGASAIEGTGLSLAPFKNEPEAQRAARVLRYAAELKARIGPETTSAIERARLGSLR